MQNHWLKEILRFGIAGGFTFLFDYSTLIILTDIIGLYYLLSSAISFSLSVIINYVICFKWVFKEGQKQTTKSLFLFACISLLGLLFNQIIMWCFVEYIIITYKLAKIISTLLVMVWNYFMKRKVVLK